MATTLSSARPIEVKLGKLSTNAATEDTKKAASSFSAGGDEVADARGKATCEAEKVKAPNPSSTVADGVDEGKHSRHSRRIHEVTCLVARRERTRTRYAYGRTCAHQNKISRPSEGSATMQHS